MRNLEIKTTELFEIKLSEQISCSGGFQLWSPTQTKLFIAATVDAAHNLIDLVSGLNQGMENAMKYRK
jgi:hypothetical protein